MDENCAPFAATCQIGLCKCEKKKVQSISSQNTLFGFQGIICLPGKF